MFPEYVEAHYLLPRVGRNGGVKGSLLGKVYAPPEKVRVRGKLQLQPPTSLFAEIERLKVGGGNMLSYFYHEASNSLPQIDCEPVEFRNLLLRMSLHDDSAASRAVLYALFSLSALSRHGNVNESLYFKDLSLKALKQSAASSEVMTIAQTLQHVAAGLMLCRSEVALGDYATTFWGLYICNLRTIFYTTFESDTGSRALEAADARILYRYVHYHEVLTKFSLGHWRRPSALMQQLHVRFQGQTLEFSCRNPLYPLMHRNLGPFMQSEMSILSIVLSASAKENYDPLNIIDQEHQHSLDEIENTVESNMYEAKKGCQHIASVDETDSIATAAASLAVQRYMFLTACWIYFQRTCRHLTGPSQLVDSMVDDVISIGDEVRRLGLRAMPFSLFLIGSEARSDERRHAILEMMHEGLRTKMMPLTSWLNESSSGISVANTHCLLSAAWAQDDLQDPADGYLDYVTKMHWIVTSRNVLPALV